MDFIIFNDYFLKKGVVQQLLLLSEVLFMLIYKTFSVLYQNDIFFRFLIAQNAALRSYKNEVRKILMSIIFEIMILKTKLDFLIIFQ